ncbi:MAG: hypothetical protein RIR70_36 [Pseudomonadota bacterium]|jgi:16S rRNA (guanine527-N7)-methyltransferase
MNTPDLLEQGIAALGIAVTQPQKEALLHYLSLLAKWNRVYNLTAVREASQMVSHHLLDSLAVLPHLPCKRLLDVGSGGGLPGIVLAIMRQDLQVVSVEAVDKKCSFQTQVKIALGLKNFTVKHARVENLGDDQGYDGIISRAFSDLAQFASLTQALVATKGYLYAMKGVYPLDEIARLPEGFAVDRVIKLEVPGLGAERHLVIIQRH